MTKAKPPTSTYLSLGRIIHGRSVRKNEKKRLLGCKATNDEAESTLGGATAQIQRYGRIALSSAGAVSDAVRNGFMYRQKKSKTDKKPTGMFHNFDDNLRHAIILVAMADAQQTRRRNNEDLQLQAKARREKEELAKEKNMDKATEEYIEATYLIKMFDSDACVKDDPKNVGKLLKKLGSMTAKYDALKKNITIRVKELQLGVVPACLDKEWSKIHN